MNHFIFAGVADHIIKKKIKGSGRGGGGEQHFRQLLEKSRKRASQEESPAFQQSYKTNLCYSMSY
jgi:hypothetical protein